MILKSLSAGQADSAGFRSYRVAPAPDMVLTSPWPLNRVENAKGLVIKKVQNYLDAYEYVWSTPGTYKVTFVAANANYQGSSEIVKDFTINIVEKF